MRRNWYGANSSRSQSTRLTPKSRNRHNKAERRHWRAVRQAINQARSSYPFHQCFNTTSRLTTTCDTRSQALTSASSWKKMTASSSTEQLPMQNDATPSNRSQRIKKLVERFLSTLSTLVQALDGKFRLLKILVQWLHVVIKLIYIADCRRINSLLGLLKGMGNISSTLCTFITLRFYEHMKWNLFWNLSFHCVCTTRHRYKRKAGPSSAAAFDASVEWKLSRSFWPECL